MRYDAIIIGGGLGGLTAGAKLSKEGKKVLLVEQHSVPGGCATTFKRKGYLFEVGLHEMDGLHPGDMKTRIFRDLGVFDQVEFLRVPEFYRFIHKEQDLVIPHDPEKAKAILMEHFPTEKEGVEAYFYQLMNAREIIKNSAGREEESVGVFLDRIIGSEDLKLALLGNLGYFHDDPYSMSLSYYSVAQGSYYAGGGNFIKGGSQKLSDYLAGVISRNGGEVLLKHLVTEILVEDNKATGISYKMRNSTESIQATGDHIIANCAIPTICDMLPGKHAENLRAAVKERKTGASLLTIYFGFNKALKNFGSRHYSTFVFGDTIKTQRDIHLNNKSDFSERGFTLIDYSQVDSALAPEGKSVGVICCIDYSSDWENLQRSEYLAKKEMVARTFISRLEKLIPGISGNIEYYEVATPKTVERYTLNPGGAVYGFAQTPERTKLGAIKSVENLYFASAWTQIGGGFSGAILNGYLSAYEILRKR